MCHLEIQPSRRSPITSSAQLHREGQQLQPCHTTPLTTARSSIQPPSHPQPGLEDHEHRVLGGRTQGVRWTNTGPEVIWTNHKVEGCQQKRLSTI